MGYDPVVQRRAVARLEKAKKLRLDELEHRRHALFLQLPELADIDRRLRTSVPKVIGTCLKNGQDPVPAVKAIRKENEALQLREAELLREAGYPPDALKDIPICKECGDSGWIGTKMCSCLKKLCAEEQVRELSKLLDLGTQSFERFSLDWYSPLPVPGEAFTPRENMSTILQFCQNYARNFGDFYNFKNLFLTGDPGLGKTFLSACIARTVAEKGFSVVYDTAVNIFSKFDALKFSRDAEESRQAQKETRRYLSCDLLILDDLGSEMNTPIVQTSLYTLINTRLVREKRTVISSNLSMDAVRIRYPGQTTSRLEGEYNILRFYGQDIRLQKKDFR